MEKLLQKLEHKPKDKISHRYKALVQLRDYLENILCKTYKTSLEKTRIQEKDSYQISGNKKDE